MTVMATSTRAARARCPASARRAPRATPCTASCRASASARSCGRWRGATASPARCATRPARWSSRSRGRALEPRPLRRRARRAGAAAVAHRLGERRRARRRSGETRLRDPREPRRRGRLPADLARRGDLRRLPGRAVRPLRPAPPLPVHQLHELRAALHHHRGRPLRPRADHDAPLRRCARRARPSTPIPRTAASTPSPTRVPDCGPRAWLARPRRASSAPATASPPRPRRCAPASIVAVKGLGGFQLAVLARRRRRGAPAARAQAPPRQAVRGHGRRPRRRARASPLVDAAEARR